MAYSFRKIHLLLLHLLILQEMAILGEAALCEAPSRLFKGACFRSRNCGTICETEGFANGRCKFFKCICSKDCNINGGGGGDEPPADGPPDEGSPPSTTIKKNAYIDINIV